MQQLSNEGINFTPMRIIPPFPFLLVLLDDIKCSSTVTLAGLQREVRCLRLQKMQWSFSHINLNKLQTYETGVKAQPRSRAHTRARAHAHTHTHTNSYD